MSFKHTSFSGSEIMRSLEKVAIEKGLIQPEKTLKKEASLQKKADLTPSNNLLSNIVKLCSGLQSAGLDHFSRDLENAFFNFKTASKNSGEDLIHEAHPKGSHRLKDMLGDAVIETIIDQQLQDLKMVQKNPTGKLSTAREIIKAVKIVLADDQKSNLQAQIKKNTDRVLELFTQVLNLLAREDGVNLSEKFLRRATDLVADPTVENLKQLKNLLVFANNTIKNYASERTWEAIVRSDIFSKMVSFIQPSIDLRKQFDGDLAKELGFKEKVPQTVNTGVDSIKAIQTASSDVAEFNRAKSDAKFKLEQIERLVNANQVPEKVKHKPTMLNWIKSTRDQIDELPRKIVADVKEEFPDGNADPVRKKELVQRRLDQLKNDLTVDFDHLIQFWSPSQQ